MAYLPQLTLKQNTSDLYEQISPLQDLENNSLQEFRGAGFMPSLLSTLWLPSQMEKQTIYVGLNEIEDPVTDLNVFVPFQQVRVRLKKYMSKAQAKCCYFVQINHVFTVISSCTDSFIVFRE